MAKAIFAYDAMAAERVLGSSLKLLAFLFTVVFIIQDNVITFRKQDPTVPQTVSTSLKVLGLASHSTLRPNGRFKSRARRFPALSGAQSAIPKGQSALTCREI